METMLHCFGVNPPSDIPAAPSVQQGKREESKPGGDRPCREAVGSLMCRSTMTRPVISDVVRAVTRHSHNSTEGHLKTVMKTMAYLHGTSGIGPMFARGSALVLIDYGDADFAGKSNDRRLVSGTVITVGVAAVS